MTTVIQRLCVLEYEAEADWGKHLVREEERFLDDEEVARLLLGAPERAQPDHGRELAMAIEVADEGDALAAMRGVMTGLALLTPFWAFVAAIILRT
jgi:hypothetical protein